MRGRNNNRNNKGPNPLTRSYESNGPDVKIRGTAQHIAEKYSQLARDAQVERRPGGGGELPPARRALFPQTGPSAMRTPPLQHKRASHGGLHRPDLWGALGSPSLYALPASTATIVRGSPGRPQERNDRHDGNDRQDRGDRRERFQRDRARARRPAPGSPAPRPQRQDFQRDDQPFEARSESGERMNARPASTEGIARSATIGRPG